MESWLQPMLCEKSDSPVVGDDWMLEPKFDGWRYIAHVDESGSIKTYARSGTDVSGKLPYIEDELREIVPLDTVLDGELVTLRPHEFVRGKRPNEWGTVQSVMGSNGVHVPSEVSPALCFVVFDMPRCKGQDVRKLFLRDRRELLEAATWSGNVGLTPKLEATDANHQRALEQGFEGTVAKKLLSFYVNGRSHSWLKIKPQEEMDVYVTGFKPGEGKFAGQIGAIEFKLPSGEASRCSGMTDDVRKDMTDNPDKYLGKIIEIAHHGETKAGKVRHPQFRRLRLDKSR